MVFVFTHPSVFASKNEEKSKEEKTPIDELESMSIVGTMF